MQTSKQITQWISMSRDSDFLKKRTSTWRAPSVRWLLRMSIKYWISFIINRRNIKWAVSGVKRIVFIFYFQKKELFRLGLSNKMDQMANYKLLTFIQFSFFIRLSHKLTGTKEDIYMKISQRLLCIIMDFLQILFLMYSKMQCGKLRKNLTVMLFVLMTILIMIGVCF